MCGIVGIAYRAPFSVKAELLMRLKRLEYRGYDSSGFATSEGIVRKRVGEISALSSSFDGITATTAIAHTRWATHGGVTEANAHPHVDASGEVFIVHNGIIENYEKLKRELERDGHAFRTETDSEVIAHFFSREFHAGAEWKDAAKKFLRSAKGTFAIMLIRKGDNAIYALKRDSPLAIGMTPEGAVLASDVYAFVDRTAKAAFFDDDEFAVIRPDGAEFFDRRGMPVKKEFVDLKIVFEEGGKREHAHFMIKEIREQPVAAERLVRSLQGAQAKKITQLAALMRKSKRVVFTAAGTSYFSTLLGVYFLNKQNVMAHTLIASEFENYVYVDKDTLVIAVSQSGETMDVVSALKYAKSRGATIASIVNIPHSTIPRMSVVSIETLAGLEVCVAATKTFTNQVIAMLYLAHEFGFPVDFEQLPAQISETIAQNEAKVKRLAEEISAKNDVYILGRGLSYPSAREFAHKMKEIAYVHAEGMMGGELKHGTLALIEEGTPVFSLIESNDLDMASNSREVKARGARVITVSNSADADFRIPTANKGVFPILSVIIGQLFAYYIALKRNLPIDKPRNLAKSVTVK